MASPLSKNIKKLVNQINNSGYIQPFTNLPNYIPVVNKQTWDYDVLAYYNQYYATAYETQQRRNYRNYLNIYISAFSVINLQIFPTKCWSLRRARVSWPATAWLYLPSAWGT